MPVVLEIADAVESRPGNQDRNQNDKNGAQAIDPEIEMRGQSEDTQTSESEFERTRAQRFSGQPDHRDARDGRARKIDPAGYVPPVRRQQRQHGGGDQRDHGGCE